MSVTARHEVGIEWGDCDPAKIVFYPNYFRWFDAATRHLFESVGLSWAELFERYGVVGLPLLDAKADFKSPSRFGDRIVVESRIEAFGRKTLQVGHTVWNADRVAVTGSETRAWVRQHPDDAARLQAIEIPPEIVARFDPS